MQKGNTEKQNQKIFQGHKVSLWLTIALPDDVSHHLLLLLRERKRGRERAIERKEKREKETIQFNLKRRRRSTLGQQLNVSDLSLSLSLSFYLYEKNKGGGGGKRKRCENVGGEGPGDQAFREDDSAAGVPLVVGLLRPRPAGLTRSSGSAFRNSP